MKQLRINMIGNHYNIYIQRGLFKGIPQRMAEKYPGRRIALITDQNVNPIYGEPLHGYLEEQGTSVQSMVIPSGESAKTLETLQGIYHQLADAGFTRGDLILALGGGVVGDVAGFAASTFLRGVPYLQVPTTLLAQIDSSVGGKVGINLPQGKNLVGSFYHPLEVMVDPDLLQSLEERNLHDGMAEVIKYACIADERLFQQLLSYSREDLEHHLEDVIHRCCRIKGLLVEKDERDRGDRRVLNFGHTLGHALESYYHYERYTHGEAVALGMVHITQRSEALGLTKKGTAESLKVLLSKYKLPVESPRIDSERLLESVQRDKKSMGDSIHIVLLEEIGRATIKRIKREEMGEFFWG